MFVEWELLVAVERVWREILLGGFLANPKVDADGPLIHDAECLWRIDVEN